jgi:hypothetical protein
VITYLFGREASCLFSERTVVRQNDRSETTGKTLRIADLGDFLPSED